MTELFKILPLFAALTAAPAFAAQADSHMGHHPAAAAESSKATAPAAKPADAQPAPQSCPMMDGKAMHCMSPPTAAKGAEAPRDRDHPAAAPK